MKGKLIDTNVVQADFGGKKAERYYYGHKIDIHYVHGLDYWTLTLDGESFHYCTLQACLNKLNSSVRK